MNDLRSRMESEVRPEMPQIEREEGPAWNPATETIDEFMARAQKFVDGDECQLAEQFRKQRDGA